MSRSLQQTSTTAHRMSVYGDGKPGSRNRPAFEAIKAFRAKIAAGTPPLVRLIYTHTNPSAEHTQQTQTLCHTHARHAKHLHVSPAINAEQSLH